MSNEKKEFPYMMVFLIAVITIIVTGITLSYVNETNHAKQNEFIENADCNSLKIYVDAGREGKDHFAYWTMESQETVNFKITPEHVDKAQLKYQWECVTYDISSIPDEKE